MLVRINLLPEARLIRLRDRKRKQYYTLLASIVIAGVVAVLVALYIFYALRLTQKNLNTSTINKQKTDVAAQHELSQNSANLQQHLDSNTTLNSDRIYVSEIFDQLVKTLPNGVTLSSFRVDENYNCTIQGIAPDLKTVGTFAKALEDFNVNYANLPNADRKPFFTNVSVDQVTKQSNSEKVNFSIKFKVDESLIVKTAQ